MIDVKSKYATVDDMASALLPGLISPVPTKRTLHAWFQKAGVPHFQANPKAERGGGKIYYSVSHVLELLEVRDAK
jgi:hypothetical protein